MRSHQNGPGAAPAESAWGSTTQPTIVQRRPRAEPVEPVPSKTHEIAAVRRPARLSPTARSLKRLRDEGYLAQVVEHWNPFAKVRVDLFGFGDVIACKPGEVLLVQATSRANVAARVAKIAEHRNVSVVRKSGMRIEVWGWSKMASGRYEVRIVDCS